MMKWMPFVLLLAVSGQAQTGGYGTIEPLHPSQPLRASDYSATRYVLFADRADPATEVCVERGRKRRCLALPALEALMNKPPTVAASAAGRASGFPAVTAGGS